MAYFSDSTGVMYRRQGGKETQIVVPATLGKEVIAFHHNSIFAAHSGEENFPADKFNRQEIDDPMWQDFEAEGLEGFTAYAPRRELAVTLGLDPIIDQAYDTLNSADRNFSKNVPRSAFSYYVWQHDYARIIAINKHRGQETFDEYRHLGILRNENYPLPTPIEEYLRAIGNVKDTTGIEFRLEFPSWPNSQGHFGQVDSNTHYHYESLACPVVLAQGVCEDLNFTMNPHVGRQWDLPDELQPEQDNRRAPTRNMLGWAQATALTSEQRQLVESASVEVDDFHPDQLQFRFILALFEKVSDFVKMAEKTIKTGSSVHESERGSVSQIPWKLRDQAEENVIFNRNSHYWEGTVSERTYTSTDRRIAIGALITALRVRKDAVNHLRLYSCYDFNNYTEVPEEWHETRNHIFEYGGVEEWNSSKYRMAYTRKAPVRQAWIRKMLKSKSHFFATSVAT
jgi:hypothetical protein